MKKILIIDDEKSMRNVIKRSLEDDSYELFEAADGSNIEQLVSQCRPDLILLDLVMPEVDGFMVLRHIQDLYTKEHKELPKILLISSFLNEDSVNKLKGLHFDDFLNKPFPIVVFKEKISNLLND